MPLSQTPKINRLAVSALSALLLSLAFMVAASNARAVGYPDEGPYCFSIGNGGHAGFPGDGVLVHDIGIDSFKVSLRWQKSLYCPLPGALEVDLQNTDNYFEWMARSLTVQTNGGHYEDWTSEYRHNDDNEYKTMVPGAVVRVRANLAYLGNHTTEYKNYRLKEDPATNLDELFPGAGREMLSIAGSPRVSAYGTSRVSFAIRNPSDPTSDFKDSIAPSYLCDPQPRNKWAKRPKKTCDKDERFFFKTAPSNSATTCPNRRPCDVPLKPNTAYVVREVVDNTFSGRNWGPPRELRTTP